MAVHFTMRRYASAAVAIIRSLSVSPSITFVICVKIIMQPMPGCTL